MKTGDEIRVLALKAAQREIDRLRDNMVEGRNGIMQHGLGRANLKEVTEATLDAVLDVIEKHACLPETAAEARDIRRH